LIDRVFSILHLSLVERQQRDLLAFRGTREAWLREALKETFEFSGWGGKALVWVPKGQRNDLIYGLIQGKKVHSFHDAPSDGGAEKEEPFWQGAYLFLDPRHHDDGQKLAIENDVLGKPRTLAKALFDHINARPDNPYNCVAELTFDETDFWKFAKESGGILKYIKFEFVVPNMWGPQNDLEEDLKSTGKETGSDQVDVTLKGKDGVTTDNEKVRTAVAYAGRGAGVVKAKSRTGRRFSSSTQPTTKIVPKADLDQVTEAEVEGVARRVLGRG
jgi:hypothetical protein